SILWIYALAGAGKTTVAETVAAWCHERDCLGSSFFCARDGDRSDVQCIVQNIASDLAHYCPEFREALLAAVRENPHIRTASVSQQVKVLLAEPIQAANAKGASWKRRVIVVDALDECKDETAESTFLQALSLCIKELAPLMFIITSRPVPNITRGFRFLEEMRRRTQELPLDEVPSELTARDITAFLRKRFEDIGRRFASAGPNWVAEEEIERVSQLAERLFIYAATVVSFVEAKNVAHPRQQLDVLLRSTHGRSMKAHSEAPDAALDALYGLYEQVLRSAFGEPSIPLQARLRRVLGTIVLAEERLSPMGLSSLLGEDLGIVMDIINELRAVLSFSSERGTHSSIRIIHLSFADFLVDPNHCKSPQFLVTPVIQHTFIALQCLELMQQALKHDICEVCPEHAHLLNHEIPGLTEKLTTHIPAALQYASQYWMRHLVRAEIGEELLAALEKFCNTHLIHWLEILSLLGCMDGAIESLRSTQLYLKATALLYDCERIVQAFYPAISASFIQVYRTAIPFSPADSLLRRLHHADDTDRMTIRMGSETAWSATLASSRVTGTDAVTAVAFSRDGTQVACGASNGSILLLNTHTAAQLQVFEGQSSWVMCISFSPSGKEIMSGSDDGKVRLWDVATGACLHTWEGYSGTVFSVAWSLDGLSTATFFYHDWRLWDISSGQWVRTMKHASSERSIVTWSPLGNLFACTDRNDVIGLWEAQTGERVGTFAGHSSQVTVVIFAADEQHLFSASRDGSIRHWNARQPQREASSKVLWQSDNGGIDAFAVSSDGKWMLSGLRRRPHTSSANWFAEPSQQPVQDDDFHCAIHLHDATGRVVWIKDQPSWFCSIAFSQDCTRALVVNEEDEVCLYDLTHLIHPERSASRSPS
ncbi:WD40 repeat-like protein, partial [Trametes sanguinea]